MPRIGSPVSAARGIELAYAEITAAQTGITSTTGLDITGLSITPTIGNRPILVTAQLPSVAQAAGTATKYVLAFLLENGTIISRASERFSGAAGGTNVVSLIPRVRRSLAAGSTPTYKVQIAVESGATVDVNAAATYPSFIQAVEL